MAKNQKKLGEILVDLGVCSVKDVEKALAHGKAKNMRIGEALVDLKTSSEANVYKALAAQYNMEYVDLDQTSVPPNAINLIQQPQRSGGRDSRSARAGGGKAGV